MTDLEKARQAVRSQLWNEESGGARSTAATIAGNAGFTDLLRERYPAETNRWVIAVIVAHLTEVG